MRGGNYARDERAAEPNSESLPRPARLRAEGRPLRFATTLRPGQGEDELVQAEAGQRKTPPLLQ